MTAYYNEIDPFAAAWLKELISAGHIAPGIVDTRSIEDVTPNDLRGFTQCHFFAGIGGWSRALRIAGWPDDRRVWTGSCPCQPFSAAGKGAGFADERHLWPSWFHLVSQCLPDTIFGEQVASADGLRWLDLVHADLENAGYAVGGIDYCAAGVGAPHIRQRLWFVANSNYDGCNAWSAGSQAVGHRQTAESNRGTGVLGNAVPQGLSVRESPELRGSRRREEGRAAQQPSRPPLRGPWSDGEWIACKDGKRRPAQPGAFPLAYGVSARVGRLCGYGNAIVPEVAAEIIRAFDKTTQVQKGA